MTDIPTLTWPLRLDADRLASTVQDTDDDVRSCIVAVLSYRRGRLAADPGFGRPPGLQFAQGGIDAGQLATAITDQEPRADAQITADAVDALGAQHVRIDPARSQP